MRKKLQRWVVCGLFGSLLLPCQVFASGFGIFTQGATGLGQGNAVVAHSSGPSAVYFNPALVAKEKGTQFEIGTTALFPNREFTSDATGQSEETEDTVYFPSTLYLTHELQDGLVLGLGVFSPFGLGTEWPDDWEGRYIATKSTITTINVNPMVAYQVTPSLAIAGGVDILYLDAELNNNINVPGVPTTPELDIRQKFTGDGTGVGFNLGVQYQLSPKISIGAAYRSKITVDIDGEAKFKIPSALLTIEPTLPYVFPKTDGDGTIDLPQQVVAGISGQLTERLVMEIGFRWEDWNSFDQLKIKLDQPVAGATEVIAPRDWHDTWALTLGGQYRLNETVTLLGGYLYGQNAIPDKTFEPAVPDSDTHLFCVGTDLYWNAFKLALSYAYQLQEDRSKSTNEYGPIANGDYENDIHLVAASLTYTF